MGKRKKVGCVIIMHPGQCNYGSSLQGFATIKKIADLGYDYEIIRYNKTRDLKSLARNLIGLLRSGGIKQYFYLQQKKKDLKNNPEFARTRAVRCKAVDAYKAAFLDPVSQFYTGYKALQKGSKDYRVIMVGSDQVWGPLSLYSRFYNLYFVDDSVPKFSYASSFGVSSIFPWQRKGVSGFLKRLDYIGVREQRGKEIVKELTGKDAKIVVDPTFLLTKEEWESEISKWSGKRERTEENKSIDEPYILTYILGEREDVRAEIKQLKKDSNLKVVNLPHIDNYHAMDDGLGDIDLYDVDPFDFIRLIRDASYVVTDSFHGSVFSILMHKKFVTFYRKKEIEKGNTNSRIDSLFGLFGLGKRLFKGHLWDTLQADIDYKYIDDKLADMRKDSLEFLQKALSLGK